MVSALIEKNWETRIRVMKKLYKANSRFNQSQLIEGLSLEKQDFENNYAYLEQKGLVSGQRLFGGEPILIQLTDKGTDFIESMYEAKDKIIEAKGKKPNIVENLLVDVGKIVGAQAPATIIPLILRMFMK